MNNKKETITISSHLGDITGIKKSNGSYFKGIPYAADTSGDNRWRAPQEPEPWSKSFDASSFGPQCPQFRMGEGGFRGSIAKAYGAEVPEAETPIESEDCLRLNVFSPDVSPKEKLPVMFWIHGGALRYGSGDPYLPDGILSKDIVLVTINYRLGELGFFAHPALNNKSDDCTTNFGLLDQIKALEWVNKNIGSFGGDPENITIFGESAGGLSVAALLVSPLSKGLFHQAIVQSGGFARMALNAYELNEMGMTGSMVGKSFCNACGVEDSPDQIDKMRELPVQEIIQKGIGYPSSLYVDNISMLSPVIQGFEEGINHKVPTIIGTNADEGTALYWGSPLPDEPPPVDTVEKYLNIIKQRFGNDEEKILSIYPATNKEEMINSSKRLLGDSLFGAPSYFAAKAMAEREEEIYFYHFNQKPSGETGEVLGSFHAYEIGYVFGVGGLGPIEDQKLSDCMLSYWTNLAKLGDPNNPDLPKWEKMKSTKDVWHELGPYIGEKDISRLEIYELLKKVI
tara:strand:- start:1329 stop:2864 length:1536 start_codon:yes stop_codon:yes gene_type:complete